MKFFRLKRLPAIIFILSILLNTVLSGIITVYAAAPPVIIGMDRSRKLDEVIEIIKAFQNDALYPERYTEFESEPSYGPKYEAGSISKEDITKATNLTKVIRYLAGLPYEDIEFTAELNAQSQVGSVLGSVTLGDFTHQPPKPSDMSDNFYQIGLKNCDLACISAGRKNVCEAIMGFMLDVNSQMDFVVHRRWILKPGARNFGIGYANNTAPGLRYQGRRVNMHVIDGLGPYDCEADTYIAWPSGDFPIQYFTNSKSLDTKPDHSWSVSLGAAYQAPSKNDITLRLTRNRDGETWIFNARTPMLGGQVGAQPGSMHLAVDNEPYGVSKTIVFRPDVTKLGAIRDGDVFTVNISGIKDKEGKAATLNYSVNFFDLEKEINRSRVNITVMKGNSPVEGAIVTIDGQNLTTNANGFATLRVKNNDIYEYSVKMSGNSKSGSITVYDNKVNKLIQIEPNSYTQAFPDANFRAEVLNLLNEQDNGTRNSSSEVSDTDEVKLAAVQALNLKEKEIRDLSGIEYFTGLTELNCYGNHLTSLDLSQNSALEELILNGNQLISLDVSKNTNLNSLICSNNQLAKLVVSRDNIINLSLTSLTCSNNQLASLDLSKCPGLKSIICFGNRITSLDVSRATNLQYFDCSDNQLKSLDVTRNKLIRIFKCDRNQLTELDASQNKIISELFCQRNYMTSPDSVIVSPGFDLIINSITNEKDGPFKFYPQNAQ